MNILNILTLIAALAALILTFRRTTLAAAAAALAMLGAFFAGTGMTAGTLWFWLVALCIAAGITAMLPQAVRSTTAGAAYFSIGATAGALIAIAMWHTLAAITVGAIAGAALGALAFGATPAGKALEFPSKRYFNYALAKGLPAAVVIAAAAVAAVYCI